MVSVVASWSVALPLPSSPHWAPRITIAGIAASFGGHASADGATGTCGKCKWPRQQRTGSLAATRYQRASRGFEASDSVRPMDPLLVITNSDAGTADDESLQQA